MLSIKNYHARHTKLIEKWIELQLNNEYEKSDAVEDEIDKREFNLRKKNHHRGSMTNLRTHVKRCPACNSFESQELLKFRYRRCLITMLIAEDKCWEIKTKRFLSFIAFRVSPKL